MRLKILVLMIAAGCYAAGYLTRVVVVDDRLDALAKMIEQQEAHQKQTYADMDRALRTDPVLDGSDYVKLQKQKLH